MKYIFYISFLFTTLFLASCNSENSKSKTSEQIVEQEKPILDVKAFIGKSLKEVEQILGKAERIEKIKGYPCKKSKCEKAFFEKEKYEVIFKKGKVDRISINDTSDFTEDDNAIQKLGLPASEPSFKNPGNVIRWTSVEGVHEISFFSTYIYIIINPAD
ncbi:hypothetical protein [Spirosoma linguale]|uniref:Lipoprotein n=1 Tax=Spirosoma linguale (strain ATCC 33905 / DSM 74 / LMG 10896 / Claus 1) TaxID=504472 RepID=D2QR13_SPILD|nr:hypothetical protein Slin_1820 [Spirosoma linguale DSM 74]